MTEVSHDSSSAPGHLLSYGHANQVTFRDAAIQDAFDIVSVPGTIATYFQQATGGFVLTLGKSYFIDPRTPLFQQNLDMLDIRQSFHTLSAAHGAKIETAVKRASIGGVNLWDEIRNIYDPDEVARCWLNYQRNYVQGSSDRIDHYAKLIGKDFRTPRTPHQPIFFTNPYWMSDSISSQEWGMTFQTICRVYNDLGEGERIVPIIAWKRIGNGDWRILENMINSIGDIGIGKILIWIDNFRERDEPLGQLRNLRAIVFSSALRGIRVGMLYGGYFSLMLGADGLWAFGNGVGYSESRAFPELPSTGAPPPRYYVFGLHQYLQPDIASQLLDDDRDGRLDIPDDLKKHAMAKDPAALSYHDLMTHFVMARGAEIKTVARADKGDLSQELIDTAKFIESHPRWSYLVNVDYLRSWAAALA